jgi:regulatory protein
MKKPRAPTILNAGRLERAALAYLERYAASGLQLRQVLERRLRRWIVPEGVDGPGMVDALMTRLAARGLIDDARYAEAKVASLSRQGRSGRAIAGRLRSKGIAPGTIAEAMRSRDEGDAERAAAIALARRRRLGPFRLEPGAAAVDAAAIRNHDLAVMARAGFALDLCRRVIDAPDPESLEEE